MTFQEFTIEFKRKVDELPFEKQLGFAITVCKKLFFDYQKFSEYYNWGDPDLLMDAIDMCQRADTNRLEVEKMILKVDSVTPDMDDFGEYIGSYALNACTSISGTLQFLLDRNRSEIWDIANFYTDTVSFKISEYDASRKDTDNHPLMIDARKYLLDQVT